jgi:DNA-binding beta-propeller fold protein YncE
VCGTDFIKFDAAGNLYVGDFQPVGRVRLISPEGVDLGDFIATDGAEGLAFDATGNLYVSSYITGTIRVFSPSGAALGAFAPAGSGFYGLAFDTEGNLYSSVTSLGIIKKFSPAGGDLGGFGIGGRDLAIIPPGGPATKDECTNGGWQSFEFPRTFKNQGDCTQFVNTGK